MDYKDKSKEELIKALKELHEEHRSLKEAFDKNVAELDKQTELATEFRWMLEHAGDAAIYRGNYRTMQYEYWSPNVEQILGFTREEMFVMGQPGAVQLIDAVDLQRLGSLIGELMSQGGGSFNIEYRFKTKDGSIRHINETGHAFVDEQNIPWYAIGSIRDITDHKLTEIEIQTAKEAADANSANVTAIIEGTDNSIWAFNRNYEIMYINQVFQQEFYQTYGVLLSPGVNLIESLPQELQSFWKSHYDRVLDNEQFTIEDTIENGNETRYLQVTFNPIVKKGQVIGGSCFGSEITHRKLAELELIHAKERAEESDRLKSAFLANMSHEIRTPMNGILGFADLLKKPELTGEEKQEYIRIIEKSGVRMLNIINDIIDISKIEAGQIQIEIKESNINEQIEYIYTFFKPEVEAKGIKFSFQNTLPSREAIIQTDREKVYAILTNLVKNAIKYTEKGSIGLGYDLIEINHRSMLQFFVKDTGHGIPKNRQEAIFERFIQADITDKMARQGAGLGLSITKAYVEMLNGQIWLESEEGNGATFYFTLPYHAGTNEYNPDINTVSNKDNMLDNKGLDLKILIAEDDETSGKLMSLMVKKDSKEILHAGTGIKAVEVCHKNPDIDLIMMDIQMPDMDGYEAIRQIRKLNKNVIIIAQTAYGLAGDKEKAIKAGCNDYVSKPVNSALLDEVIKRHFS